ncbi:MULTISPECIES: hypothetical protein [Paraburkholderia]|uniref:hypothetical protein n=1 Tax=Paraburkholderia TaxID=1822464 RepID=UPI00165586F7|nr:hypothetical protein [Paraburkholderia podalyriae]
MTPIIEMGKSRETTGQRGGASSPAARMKQALNDSLDQPASITLRYERALSNLHHCPADRVEGLVAFKEKRPPKFEGK